MATTISGWTTLSESPAVLVHEYGFGAGRANALAVQLPSRKWLIVSPPPKMSAAEAAAFSAHGEVVALVENNGTHHMGLGPCRALFPTAVAYAEPAAAARIRKKNPSAGQLEPIAALSPMLGDAVSIIAADGCKIGDVIVRVRSEKGVVLYTSDFIANISKLPRNPVFRLLFKLTGSGPGLKVFRIFFTFFVADKKAAIDFLVREIEAHPPAIMVPAHGDVVARPDLAPTLLGMLKAAR
jgi:hypothetical protein